MLDLLEIFLNTQPRIFFTNRDTFTGKCTPRSRVVSHRYNRILRGELLYTIDQTLSRLAEGAIFFIPRGARRSWEVPPGKICEMLWCEFDIPGASPDPHTLYFTDDGRNGLEKAALLRIAKLWTFPRHLRDGAHGDPSLPRSVALQMEGELKASLARFWTKAEPWTSGLTSQTVKDRRAHPSVRQALAWMEGNFSSPDALERLYEEVLDLSPNHFRLLFLRYTGASVSSHLRKLRMQEAMNLLRTSALSIKEVAAAVGFNDPLYFSKRFHEFWDIAPTGVRK